MNEINNRKIQTLVKGVYNYRVVKNKGLVLLDFLYKDSDIIILDEATNALMKKMKKILLMIFFSIKSNKTLIIIYKRDFKTCDRVIEN